MSVSVVEQLNAALLHHQSGRLAEAAQLYRYVLTQDPVQADALRLLGTVAHQSEDLPLAERYYHQAIAANPSIPDAYTSLGKLYVQQNRVMEAIALYQTALQQAQPPESFHRRLAPLLDTAGDHAAAVAHYQAALDYEPHKAVLHHNLATVLHKQGCIAEAIAHYQQATTLQPDYAKAYLNWGSAERQLGHLSQAIAHYQQALALDERMAEAHDALGSIALSQRELEQAIAHYRRAVDLNPNYAEAHFNLAIAYLLKGDLPRGFAEYEWRLQIPGTTAPQNLTQPRWRGEWLQGQRILLYAEQGFGDAIQFVRYVPLVVERGGRVVVGCPEPLTRLFQAIPGVEAAGNVIAGDEVQWQAPLMSLPYIFGTGLTTLPATVPYLVDPLVNPQAPETKVSHAEAIAQKIAAFAGDRCRVGLVWAGSAGNRDDGNRSCGIEALRPLWELASLAFYSLQKGDRAVEAGSVPADVLLDLSEMLTDFADTATAIAQLDLVITVDTAVAHLAGAMGKPVWVLLSHAPDWRWLLEGSNSPWYPTARLFRQPEPGNWAAVMAEVVTALATLTPSPRQWPAIAPRPIPTSAPDPFVSQIHTAFAQHQAGDLDAAEACYRQVLQAQPNHIEALQLLGTLLCQREDYRSGVIYLRQALAINPDYAEGHYNLASALQSIEDSEAAIASFQQAIALRPNYPEAYFNLGNVYKQAQRYAEAAEQFRLALVYKPNYPKAWRGLGASLQYLERYDEAIQCYQRALAIDPDYAHAYSSWGYALTEQGHLTQAFDTYAKAIALDPDHVDAQFGRAAILLRWGDYIQGLPGYEWRWKYDYCPPRNFSQPLWQGDRLNGRTILLHDEQGLGDAIQAIRFAEFVKPLGGRVILECRDVLARLFGTVPGIDELVVRGQPLPEFDCHVPLMSLAWRLGCTLETLPHRVPYLTVPEGVTMVLPGGTEPSFKVGMVWGANPVSKTAPKRTCPLRYWAAIAQLEGIQLYSLQKDPSPDEANWLATHGVIDLSPSLKDLADTAAAIAQLDVVITVDTAVAHLSGALGKPTWILLPFMPDWRWLVERTDSPWYPTARLFRQPSPSDWDAVMAAVVQAWQTERPLPTGIPVRPASLTLDTVLGDVSTETLGDRLTVAYAAYRENDFAAAEQALLPLRQDYPDHANVLNLAGVLAMVQQRLPEAIALFQQGLRSNPNYAEIHGNLGMTLRQQNQDAAAIHHYQRAIALNPGYLAAYCNLGNIFQAQERLEEAIALYHQALSLDPNYTKVWMNLGNALAKQARRADAIAAYQRAIALDPDYLEAYSNLGNLYAEFGNLDQGIAAHEKAIALQPNDAQAQHNFSIALLRQGDYLQGFRRYEYRWQLPDFWERNGRTLPQPQWDGTPLAGRRLLIWGEQGFGDVLQFLRFVPLVTGGQVILEVHPALVRLLPPDWLGVQVVPGGTPLPEFDVHLPLMSLARVLGTTLETLPLPPRLLPPPSSLSLPASSGKLKVGLVWAAKATHPTCATRSLSLVQCQSWFDLPQVTFYSLQKDCPEADRQALADSPIHDLSADLGDFGDTAAAIAQLDLVITVDTSVAHLAGAMHHATWVLLSIPSDWRWLLDRADSPWYPSVRLFRQEEPQQWDTVIAAVREALLHWPTLISGEAPRSGDAQPVAQPLPDRLPAPAIAAPMRPASIPAAMSNPNPKSKSKSKSKSKPKSKLTQSSSPAMPQPQGDRAMAQSDRPKLSALLDQAVTAHRGGDLAAAEALYQEIRQWYPQDGNAVHLLGVIAYQRGNLDEAVEQYRAALQLAPNYAEIHNNLAVCLDKLGQSDAALTHYQQAIALKPEYAEAWHNLGTLYQAQEDIDAAIQYYQKAIALQPDYADGYNSWGSALKRIDQLDEALTIYNRALELDANHLEARCGRSAVLLKMGQWDEGWVEYEWRWQHPDCPPRIFQEPTWQGEPFHGKTLLLYTEQGLGDAIQMIRYVPLVRERGDRLWVECNQPGLARLFQTVDGIDHVFERGTVPPEFHLQAPLMSLPRIFGTTLTTVPASTPYLRVPQEVTFALPRPDGAASKLAVGIVWTANRLSKTGKNRSCALDLFRPLLQMPSVQVYSLQKEILPDEQALLDEMGAVSLGHQFTDLADTAGAIAQLDLVITVDTVIAHLAGALGKPTWVLLHLSCDWRWLSQRSDTPWYPTVRLFRQPSLSNWTAVMAEVMTAIAAQVSAIPAAAPAAAPVPETVRLLGVGWPMSLMTGWGNFGVNLVLQLQQMKGFVPVLLAKSEGMEQLNPLHRSLLAPALAECDRLQGIMAANPGKQMKLNIPVLHALGNGLSGGLQTVRGSRNVGVIFLEDTALPPEAIARGRQFDMIAAGSQWNETILRAAGLEHTYALPQGIDPTRFHPGPASGLLGDRFVIFSGGKLEYRKGQDIVVAAFRRFVQNHPDALLLTAWHNFWPQFMRGIDQTGHVVGLPEVDAQRRLRVTEWLVNNGIPAQNVMDIGPIPNYLMGEVIREANVAVFPNRGEGGTNLAAMECLACGIPTILSANTGHLDLLGDSQIPPHCYPLQQQGPVKPLGGFAGVEGWGESAVDEVVALLERVYSDRTEARQRGRAAAEFMQDWTWAKQVRRLCDRLCQLGMA